MFRYKPFFGFVFILFLFVGINAQSRNSLTWEVLRYDINATLPQNFASDRDLDVKATLTLQNISNSSASSVTLRISEQAEVSAIQVGGTSADFKKSEEKIGGNRNLQKLATRIASVSPKQTVTVVVDYKMKVASNSGLNALSPVNSQFLPLSYWYPTPTSWYFPAGADVAQVNLKINSSNGEMLVASGTNNGNSFEQKLFTQPFFATGNWDIVKANGVDVYVPKGMNANSAIANDLASIASEAKTFATKLFGKTFDSPIRIVGVSRGSGFSDGGTIFIDQSVFQRQKVDSQTAVNVIESIVKVWLGNVFKVQDDGYGVIREGLSRHIANEFIEQKFGKDEAELERLRQRTNYSAISLRDTPLNVVSPIDGYYYTATANKGAIIWNFLSNTFGDDFYELLRSQADDGELNLKELRDVFSTQKGYLDYMIERITEMNLMVGLPQQNGSQTKVALRNMSEIDVNVDVVATTSNGQKIVNKAAIKANSFGETVFNTPNKIIRVEVDADKIYPQTDYSDDIAPREIGDNDALVFIKKEFDKQNKESFEKAEKNASEVLKIYPNFDDARILLARSQLAQNKITDAQKNFEEVLKLKLPTAQSMAWANVGLGEIAQKTGQNANARKFFDDAIKNNSDLGATLAARRGRNKIGATPNIDAGIKTFFASFDKSVTTNNKSEIDAMILNGEISRFSANVAGQAQQWSSQLLQIDKIDDRNMLVEANISVKLLNRETENKTAIYHLTKVGNDWKLTNVEIFEAV